MYFVDNMKHFMHALHAYHSQSLSDAMLGVHAKPQGCRGTLATMVARPVSNGARASIVRIGGAGCGEGPTALCCLESNLPE